MMIAWWWAATEGISSGLSLCVRFLSFVLDRREAQWREVQAYKTPPCFPPPLSSSSSPAAARRERTYLILPFAGPRTRTVRSGKWLGTWHRPSGEKQRGTDSGGRSKMERGFGNNDNMIIIFPGSNNADVPVPGFPCGGESSRIEGPTRRRDWVGRIR